MSLIDEARSHLETADRIGTPKPMTEYHLQLALVKSQLALAEQQRIANLLALADHSLARFGNYAGAAGGMGTLFSWPQEESGNIQIRDDIREELGL